jgi:phosphoribosylformimino-5-aminoimidazole carboxamide ribonucleotide (ProFAR) isomerase
MPTKVFASSDHATWPVIGATMVFIGYISSISMPPQHVDPIGKWSAICYPIMFVRCRSAVAFAPTTTFGADWVIVGTRALEEPAWLEETAAAFPGRLIVAADVRERNVVTRGWSRQLRRTILDVVDDMNGLALGGLLVTAVHREGLLQGTDLPLMEDVAEASAWPVYASGGIATMADLRALDERGIAGVVIGMALYTGTLDPRLVAEEFAQ